MAKKNATCAVRGTITANNWSSGQLDINLQNTVIPAVPGTLYKGDQHALRDNNGNYNLTATGWSPEGSLTNGVAEVNFDDVIYGSLDDEVLNGFGGNGALDVCAGNGEINGGAVMSSFLPQMVYGNTLVSQSLTHTAKSSLTTMASFEINNLNRRCKRAVGSKRIRNRTTSKHIASCVMNVWSRSESIHESAQFS